MKKIKKVIDKLSRKYSSINNQGYIITTSNKISQVNKIIIEASVLFATIFPSIGFLIAGTNQVKDLYTNFGYMLYYSIPFILAILCATMAFLCPKQKKLIADIMSIFAITFFFSGLSILFLLAIRAAGSILLAGSFMFIAPYQRIASEEFFTMFLFTSITFLTVTILCLSSKLRKYRNALGIILILILVSAIFIAATAGIQTKSNTVSNKVQLDTTNQTMTINQTFQSADKITISASTNDTFCGLSLFSDQDYQTYQNIEFKENAHTIYQAFGYTFSDQEVINYTDNYHIVFDGFGNNATMNYTITTYSVNSSIALIGYYTAIISASIFLGIVVFETKPASNNIDNRNKELQHLYFD